MKACYQVTCVKLDDLLKAFKRTVTNANVTWKNSLFQLFMNFLRQKLFGDIFPDLDIRLPVWYIFVRVCSFFFILMTTSFVELLLLKVSKENEELIKNWH